jgi:hypothetical protein
MLRIRSLSNSLPSPFQLKKKRQIKARLKAAETLGTLQRQWPTWKLDAEAAAEAAAANEAARSAKAARAAEAAAMRWWKRTREARQREEAALLVADQAVQLRRQEQAAEVARQEAEDEDALHAREVGRAMGRAILEPRGQDAAAEGSRPATRPLQERNLEDSRPADRPAKLMSGPGVKQKPR